MDDYLNKYFQSISEFIQFVITVFLLKPRKFYQVEKCVWLRRGKCFSHSEFIVCLFGSCSSSYAPTSFLPLLLSSPLLSAALFSSPQHRVSHSPEGEWLLWRASFGLADMTLQPPGLPW